jgi:nitrogen fixation/metabolism regulation signal transduction histidine kinase
MRVLIVILGIVVGIAVAWLLNKLLSGKIENKSHRIGLQVGAYIVFILIGFAFTSLFSLRTVLDTFIDNRIQFIEENLSKMFPDTNILEARFNISELVSINDQLQQSINVIDTKSDNFFERLVYNAFLGKLFFYINAVDTGVTTLSNISDDDGSVTIRSILYGIKNIALDTASPYIKIIQIILFILFFISIFVYVGIVIYIKKGGALYNKSIVYGDNSNK